MQARDIRELGHETPDAEGAAPKRDSGIRPVAQADRPTMPPPRRRAPPSLDALRRAGPSAFTAASAAVDEDDAGRDGRDRDGRLVHEMRGGGVSGGGCQGRECGENRGYAGGQATGNSHGKNRSRDGSAGLASG